MRNDIKLIKNNDSKDWSDLEWIDEFYQFLQGDVPEGMLVEPPQLDQRKAFAIIWYLQEHFSILPDNIEKCDVCGELYNANSSGQYSEIGNEHGYFFCNCCDHLAPVEDSEID